MTQSILSKKNFFYKPFYNFRESRSLFLKINKKIVCYSDVNFKTICFEHIKLLDERCVYICKKLSFKNKKISLAEFFNFFYSFLRGEVLNFFFKFRIVGLGFKLRRLILKGLVRYLRLELGYSHVIFYKIPPTIGVFVKKKTFFLHSADRNLLRAISARICNFKIANPYKEKGVIPFSLKIKLKSGKQQQR